MNDSGSDLDLHSALPKKKTKLPTSPMAELLSKDKDPKRATTKMMIRKALTDLHTRKGISIHAIKKYMTENFDANTEKLNFFIKKAIKTEVEKGVIIQTKGIGASGSFRLAPVKKEVKIKKPKIKETSKKEKDPNKPKKTKKTAKEPTKDETKTKKTAKKEKPAEKESKTKKKKIEKPNKQVLEKKKPPSKTKDAKAAAANPKKSKSVKMATAVKTPAKKRVGLLKRKSIGSIIKPPKMKPKSIKAK